MPKYHFHFDAKSKKAPFKDVEPSNPYFPLQDAINRLIEDDDLIKLDDPSITFFNDILRSDVVDKFGRTRHFNGETSEIERGENYLEKLFGIKSGEVRSRFKTMHQGKLGGISMFVLPWFRGKNIDLFNVHDKHIDWNYKIEDQMLKIEFIMPFRILYGQDGKFYRFDGDKPVPFDHNELRDGGTQEFRESCVPICVAKGAYGIDYSGSPPGDPKIVFDMELDVHPNFTPDLLGLDKDSAGLIDIKVDKSDLTPVPFRKKLLDVFFKGKPEQTRGLLEAQVDLNVLRKQLQDKFPDMAFERFSRTSYQGVETEGLAIKDKSTVDHDDDPFMTYAIKKEDGILVADTVVSTGLNVDRIAVIFEMNKYNFPLTLDPCGSVEDLLLIAKAAKYVNKEVHFSEPDQKLLDSHPDYQKFQVLDRNQYLDYLRDNNELRDYEDAFPEIKPAKRARL